MSLAQGTHRGIDYLSTFLDANWSLRVKWTRQFDYIGTSWDKWNFGKFIDDVFLKYSMHQIRLPSNPGVLCTNKNK